MRRSGSVVARPRKQGLSYFPHDTDAINDEKIASMLHLFGLEGYGLVFALYERIYRTPEGKLPLNDTLERVLANAWKLDLRRFRRMLRQAVELGVFDEHAFRDGVITSNGIYHRVNKVASLRGRDLERKGYSIGKGIPPLPENSRKTAERKGKERKGKELSSTRALAEEVYDFYKTQIRAGARESAVRSITRLLPTHSKEELIGAIEEYSKSGLSEDTKYRIQANNFFGVEKRFKDYLPTGAHQPEETAGRTDQGLTTPPPYAPSALEARFLEERDRGDRQ